MVKKKILELLSVLLVFFFTSCPAEEADEADYTGFRPLGDENLMKNPAQWGELNTHDPSIIKDGDTYYVFSTDASYGDIHKSGVQIRTSKDLITWLYAGTAFENYAGECAEAVRHAKLDTANNQGFWAPDILRAGDVYRLYFSASTFGSSRSCISLAESGTPEGPYEFKGIVVKSDENALNGANAIDPAVIEDGNGRMYMSYGSFFGGIFIAELDPETGFLKDEPQAPIRIAGSRGAAVEASVIRYIPESGYYYLFVSFGSLFSSYNIVVGRSKNVTGPYLDAEGNDLASLGIGNEDRVGTKLMGGYTFVSDPGVPPAGGTMAPGHNSVLIDGEDYFIVHHARTYTLPHYWFTMNVRRFALNRFHWPVVMPHRYHGEQLEAIGLPNGEYGLVQHGTDSNAESRDSTKIRMEDGAVSGSSEGSYRIYDDYRIEIALDGILYDGVVANGFDMERNAEVVMFTAMSETGLCVWGSTQ